MTSLEKAYGVKQTPLEKCLVKTVNVDTLAAEGVGFFQAMSHVPVTLPSHATIITGLLPSQHGVRSNGIFRLSDTHITLAEILRQKGYATGAFIGATVLDSRYGLAQGFDVYDDVMDARDQLSRVSFPQRSGEVVVSSALAWLESLGDQPAFTWVHLFDPHKPYLPPEPERSLYPESKYDAEIAYTDRVVGMLLDGFRRSGRYEKAVIVVTSDHGESLGEHGENTHAIFIYDATMHVPLVIKAPGTKYSGRKVMEPVGLVDLFPTILDLLGTDIPPHINGTSLNPLMSGRAGDTENSVYLESLYPKLHHGWAEYRGLRTSKWKLIVGTSPELYRLSADPNELNDLADSLPQKVDQLHAVLNQKFPEDQDSESSRIKPSSKEIQQLESLGYISSRPGITVRNNTSLPDPRQHIGDMNRIDEAMSLSRAGKRDQALGIMDSLVKRNPDAPLFWKKRGDMLVASGKLSDALVSFDTALNLNGEDADGWVSKALILQRMNRIPDAIRAYEMALSVEPTHEKARHHRWGVMLMNKQIDDVRRESAEALHSDPTDAMARWASARVNLSAKNIEGAITDLETGLRESPQNSILLIELGMTVEDTRDFKRAELLYRTALKTDVSGLAENRLNRLLLQKRGGQ